MGRQEGISSFSVILITIALMVTGVVLIPQLSIQFQADYASNDITVNYYYPASARAVETEVTTVIEGAVNTLPGVGNISSISAWGCGSVTATFKKGTDMTETRFNLNTRLRQIKSSLPADAEMEIAGNASGRRTKNILTFTFYTDRPLEEASAYIEDNMLSVIGTMAGVERAYLNGVPEEQLEVIYDTDVLESAGFYINDLHSAILNSSSNHILGSKMSGTSTMTVRLLTRTDSDSTLAELPIGKSGDRIFRLGDLARIRKSKAEPMSIHRINGLECLQIGVYAADGVNTINTCAKVREKADEVFSGFPDGYVMEITYDASESLGEQIWNVVTRALVSLLLLLSFVLIVVRNLKFLSIIVISVLSDLLISVTVISLFHIGIDMFSITGITVALGIVMDNAIVMTDHYLYYRNRKAASPIATALFTTNAALLLVFYLPAELRRNLTGFVWIVVIILTLSFVTSLLLVPALVESSGLKGNSLVPYSFNRRRRIVRFSQWYANCICRLRRRRILILSGMILLFGGSCCLFVFYNRLYDADMDAEHARTLDLIAMMPDGYGMAHCDHVARLMENYLSGIDEIKRFETDVSGSNASFSISFKEDCCDEIKASAIRDAIWEKALTIGGASWTVMPYGDNDRLLTNFVGRREWPDRFTLYGYDYDMLCQYATLVMNDILQNPRVKDAAVLSSLMSDGTEQEYVLEYDRERLAQMDMDPYMHFISLAERLIDVPAGHFRNGNENLPVVLKSDELEHLDLWHAQNDAFGFPGSEIRLSEIGSITNRNVGGIIERENQEYVVEVGYEFIGSDLSKLSMCYNEEEKLAGIMPLGFRTDSDYAGYTPEEKMKLWTLLIVVVCVIFGICAVMFESARLSLAIILLIPSGFIGIFLLFPFLGLKMGQGSLASMVMMSGLVVNAAIYITAEFRDICCVSRQPALRIYVKAFNRKIIPTVLTVASTVVGLLPFLFDGGGSVFWFTFSAGVMIGLVFSLAGLFFCFPLFLPDPAN